MSSNKTMANVNDGQFEFTDLNPTDLDIIQSKEGTFHILHEEKSFRAEILDVDFTSNTFIIQINDSKFTVELLDEYAQLVQKMGFSLHEQTLIKNIMAPMPGLILSIEVAIGDEIKKGEAVTILEAMKMENVIKAPCDGVIKNITIKAGEAVEKGQLLIELV